MAAQTSSEFRFAFDEPSRTWTLRNRVISASFTLTPEGFFLFNRLTRLANNESWESPGGVSPLSLRTNRAALDAFTTFQLTGNEKAPVDRNGYRQTITLDVLGADGVLIVELEMYAGQPVLRYRVRFQPSQPTIVRGVDLLPWSFAGAGQTFRAFRVNQWSNQGLSGNFETMASVLSPSGLPITITTGSNAQHCAWLAVRNGADKGLFAGWEFDGRATTTAQQISTDGSLRISTQIQQMNHPIQRGDEFATPWAFVGLYHGDWDEAGYRTQRFVEAALAPPMPDDNFPYVIWDSWHYQQDIDEDTLRLEAELAAKLGIEVFVVDLGWANDIGDWVPDPVKFPSGLAALSDYVHSLGMKFGLHFPFAEAALQSPVLRAHPDWTASQDEGYFDAKSICLSHQPVRQWVLDEAVRIIDQYGVDWLLQDGENMVKVCTKRTHTHDPSDSNYANSADGLNWITEQIKAARPHVLLENCEDGGKMMTFNMTKRYVTSIAADDSGPLTTRQAVHGVTYPFPPRYADRYLRDEELGTLITRSYMFGGPWIFMTRLLNFRQEDIDLATSEIRIYKSIRKRISEGKVFHLTARPTQNRTDAIESYHPATDTAIVIIARNTATSDIRIKLGGLKRLQNYRVSFQDNPAVFTMTGAQLLDQGITPELPGMWSAEIMYIEPLPAAPAP